MKLRIVSTIRRNSTSENKKPLYKNENDVFLMGEERFYIQRKHFLGWWYDYKEITGSDVFTTYHNDYWSCESYLFEFFHHWDYIEKNNNEYKLKRYSLQM